jgi:hypothetical protein
MTLHWLRRLFDEGKLYPRSIGVTIGNQLAQVLARTYEGREDGGDL